MTELGYILLGVFGALFGWVRVVGDCIDYEKLERQNRLRRGDWDK